MKVFALLILVLQNTCMVLVTKFSFQRRKQPYAVSTVVACSEFLKLLSSYFVLVLKDGQKTASDAVLEVPASALQLALPSVLYTIQNNLIFEGVRLLSPTTFMVCSQSKILTSAFFSGLLLKTNIIRRQYAALVILICGMILVQSDELGSQQALDVDATAQWTGSEQLIGCIVVFVASCISGFAGTYLEKLFRESGVRHLSIWHRNFQLACFSFPISCLTVLCQNRLRVTSCFQGYDVLVVFIITLHASGGIIVATVLKYAGNVLKCFAISISICTCAALASFSTGEDNMSIRTAIGIFMVIVSTFMYTR